jgi:hypothetical protein
MRKRLSSLRLRCSPLPDSKDASVLSVGVQRLPSFMALLVDEVLLMTKHGGTVLQMSEPLSVFLHMRFVSLCLRCFLTDRIKRIDGAAMLWEQMLCLTL